MSQEIEGNVGYPSTGKVKIEKHKIPVKPNNNPTGRHPEVEHQVRGNPATHKPGVKSGK